MENYNVPQNIKKKILFDNIFSVSMGIVLTIGIIMLKFFVIKNIDDTTIKSIFDMCMYGIIGIASIFLVGYPLISLLFGGSYKSIEKFMRENKITTDIMAEDFDKSKRNGKVRIGKICTYVKTMFSFRIIPNSKILWVYKRTKIMKQKRVNRSLNGDIKNERYLMSERYVYSVIIRTDTGGKITVSCSGKIGAENILKSYDEFGNILVGESKENKKVYERKRKEIAIQRKS